MKRNELLMRLKSKSATKADGNTPPPAAGDAGAAGGAPAAGAVDLAKVMEALTALTQKIDLVGEALTAILEGQAPAEDKPADGEEKPVDEMSEEEMGKELAATAAELEKLDVAISPNQE